MTNISLMLFEWYVNIMVSNYTVGLVAILHQQRIII